MAADESLAKIHGLSKKEVEILGDEVQRAKQQAYCPYSNFPVGSTILLKDTSIVATRTSSNMVSGANIENAAYPSGACAERNAINTAVFLGMRIGDVRAIVVTTNMQDTCSPCGNCRQVIREFCEPDTPIFMFNRDGNYIVKTLEELLPMSFGPESLGRNVAVE